MTMAILFGGSGDTYHRTTNLPGITAFTIMAWVKISFDTGTFATFIGYGQADSGFAYLMGTYSDGDSFGLFNGSVDEQGSVITVGTWTHIAMTVIGTSGSNFLGYRNGVLNIVATAVAGMPSEKIVFGDYATTFNDRTFNGCLAAVKIYADELTEAQIAQEMRCYMPIKRTNLNSWYPMVDRTLANNAVDYAGVTTGNTLTAEGALTVTDGPPIPWRIGSTRRWYTLAAAPSAGQPAIKRVAGTPGGRLVAPSGGHAW